MSNQISWYNPDINPWMEPRMTEADERLLSSCVQASKLAKKLSKRMLPVDVMPPGAIPLYKEGTLAASAAIVGLNTLFTFEMPAGNEGLVTHRSHDFLGAGLANGSGGAIWQLKIGNGWAMNCGSMLVTIPNNEGSVVTNNGGYRVMTGQTIIYQVVLTAGQLAALDPAGVLAARIRGWYKPC